MPRNALQHSHMPLHVCTSTQSQNKVSLCTHRGIFICTDITGGRMPQANAPRDRQGCIPKVKHQAGHRLPAFSSQLRHRQAGHLCVSHLPPLCRG